MIVIVQQIARQTGVKTKIVENMSNPKEKIDESKNRKVNRRKNKGENDK